MLAREVASPRYGSYFIFFTNRVKRADLKSLAEADGNEVVSDLKEIPSDFLVFESHVFTTKLPTEMPFPVKNLQWNKENSALQRYGLLSNYKYFQCIPSYVFFLQIQIIARICFRIYVQKSSISLLNLMAKNCLFLGKFYGFPPFTEYKN